MFWVYKNTKTKTVLKLCVHSVHTVFIDSNPHQLIDASNLDLRRSKVSVSCCKKLPIYAGYLSI